MKVASNTRNPTAIVTISHTTRFIAAMTFPPLKAR
jgi:hypothetical protein